MADVTIFREDSDTKGRYVAQVEGFDETGELTFSKASDSLIIVDHTGVPETMRGKGVAAALAKRAIEDARTNGQKIMPLCPYMKVYAQRHRDKVSDVVNL